uniref:Prepilin leader peptidase/N-methyltransferase n=1 Tax=Candidatus Kentrum eta TaxID=2126337 RepID=A0A450U755_9GAMM|nr:MAG: Prepilin signal peptidase PulO (type II secretory pathway) [Candidatus Kentron sp. H]VFJ89320.1 MAG: Prepilin signal peptidase PulO (type II secretory pathway) [Candidatus Kentron sp. H]VFJ95901.1 MAG: Prepilin signal peptidase PulO (type II secretory pathway) [Candidatus Kentron sp. H]
MTIDLPTIPPIAFIAIGALLGLMVGSFLNVVIARLPVMMARDWRGQCAELCGRSLRAGHGPRGNASEEALCHLVRCRLIRDSGDKSATAASVDGSVIDGAVHGPDNRPGGIRPGDIREAPFNLMAPRSHCPHCGHTLSITENIPLISYLLLGGRCAACHLPIPARYPLVESAGAVMAGIVAWRLGVCVPAIWAMILTWILIALAFMDFEHQQLPDAITLPTLWLGLTLNLFTIYTSVAHAVIGAILGYGVLWIVYHLFRFLTGKEGMGYGDFKLFAMAGAWLGWQALPAILLMASVAAATVGIALIRLGGHDRNVPIPFGPYIAMATWVVLLWGAY